jgi:hypothetical protein
LTHGSHSLSGSLSIRALSGPTTMRIKTLGIKALNITISKNDTQHKLH